MLRRHPDAVITAHVMDPARRELYVEGSHDRLFLGWLLGGSLGPDSSIREIAQVDLPDECPGGEKGRLVYFAELLGDRNVQIRMFADADWDLLLNRRLPARVWLTDYRDMEGYILREECVDKVLRLGIGTDQLSGVDLLRAVRANGRRVGLIRLMSEIDDMHLPFQAMNLKRYLRGRNGSISVDLQKYLTALLQNAEIKLSRLQEIKARLHAVETAYSSTPDRDLVHGKDATCMIETALSWYGLKPRDGARLLWTSFEPTFVERGSTLELVTGFLRGE